MSFFVSAIFASFSFLGLLALAPKLEEAMFVSTLSFLSFLSVFILFIPSVVLLNFFHVLQMFATHDRHRMKQRGVRWLRAVVVQVRVRAMQRGRHWNEVPKRVVVNECREQRVLPLVRPRAMQRGAWKSTWWQLHLPRLTTQR